MNRDHLTVWHSFAAESQEEAVFFDAIAEFELTHPHIQVEVTGIPFADIDRQYEIAAQAGQAPDIVRLSSDQLGKIGEIQVNGYPLLEDLRPHLTPFERSIFDEKALQSMRYGDALYGLPASQDCCRFCSIEPYLMLRGWTIPIQIGRPMI